MNKFTKTGKTTILKGGWCNNHKMHHLPWEKDFDELFVSGFKLTKQQKENTKIIKDFIRNLITKAREEERKYIGKQKREWYQKGYREGQEAGRKEIFKLLNMQNYSITDSIPVWVIIDVFRKLNQVKQSYE